MRFVVRLVIAIATLVSSAILCWGQEPSYLPPSTVEGAWVSDDGPAAGSEMLVDPGASYMGDPAMMGVQPGCACGDGGACGDGSCADGSCGAGDGYGNFAGPGAFAPGGYWTDLWTEVHAHRRMWVQVDYLSAWTKGNQLPPLVTTSPLGTPQTIAGVLPESATTQVLFGNQRVDAQQRNGGRVTVGYWLLDGEFLGIEGQYFTFQPTNTTFSGNSDFTNNPNSQILARPFVNFDPNLPTPTNDASLIAFPNFNTPFGPVNLNGTIDIRTTSYVQSANATLRRLIWIDFTTGRRLDIIGGYRFFRVDDSVSINDSTTTIGGVIAQTTFASRDQFSARNQFHGGELGLKFQTYHGPFQLELIGKVGFGNMREQMYINGFNSVSAGGVTVTNSGGLLTQTSNIGTFQRDVFAILPEADANFRVDLTPNLRATIGYTFIYTNRVQRSGDAIDLGLNPTQINGGALAGAARPAFSFHDTTYWLQAVSAGLEYRW